MIAVSIVLAVLCAILWSAVKIHEDSALLQPDPPVTLGQTNYDMKLLKSPVAHTYLLEMLSFVLTKTMFGSTLCRYLLDDNKIFMLRELADQVHMAPMNFPLRRLNREERAMYDNILKVSSDRTKSLSGLGDIEHVLQKGMPNSKGEGERSGSKHRSINEYAEYYRRCSTDRCRPSSVMKRALNAAHQWANSSDFIIFSSLMDSDVISQAEASDARHKAGTPLSILDGVPIAIKDMCDVKGHPIYKGSTRGPFNIAQKDDLLVARLRELGAIIFGTTVMVEGGVSPLGYNAMWKGPFNPYSTSRFSGGSSSGSAVSVATGLVPAAIGFDGGGSIRVPCAMSGLHGLGGTFGRIPFDADSVHSTMIKAGPMTKTAEDAAIVYAAIARNAPDHFYSRTYDGGAGHGLPEPTVALFEDVQDLKDVRIGIFKEWFDDSSENVRDLCQTAINSLVKRGATIVPIAIPHLHWLGLAHGIKISTEFAGSFDRRFQEYTYKERAPKENQVPGWGNDLEHSTRITLALGKAFTAVEMRASDKLRAWAFEVLTTEIYGKLNLTIIASPTIPIVAPHLSDQAKILGESNSALMLQVMRYVAIGNFLGLPAYTVPVGFAEAAPGAERLPVGLQLMGDHWTEHQLLRLAHAIEEEVGQDSAPPLMHHFDPFA